MKKSICIILLTLPFIWTSYAQSISIQERLGYSKDTKLLIIHADDIGVSHSENIASIYAMENGSVNSGSLMVPCPWFPEIAAYASTHPNADFGLHLTITSEWKYYKWKPLSSSKEVPGLVNENNFFYGRRAEVKNNASASEIEKELKNQIETALKYGIQITHLDSHMFGLYLKPEFLEVYKKLGKEYKLPILLNKEYMTLFGLDFEHSIEEGDIVVDKIYMALTEDYEKGMDQYYTKILKTLQPGLNEILLHAAYSNEEMKAVTIDHSGFGADWRQQDFNFFTSETCNKIIHKENIQLITWREIKDKLIND